MKFLNGKKIDLVKFPWFYTGYFFSGLQGIVYCLYFLVFETNGVLGIPFEIMTVLCFIVGVQMILSKKISLTEVLLQRPRIEKVTDYTLMMYGVIYLVMRKNLDTFGDPTSDVFCLGNIVIFGCNFLGRVLVDLVSKED